jgi:arginyl-tRNA--protein-N-Asp/Glu arginylyltransferase
MGEDEFVRSTVEINLKSKFKIIDNIKKMGFARVTEILKRCILEQSHRH